MEHTCFSVYVDLARAVSLDPTVLNLDAIRPYNYYRDPILQPQNVDVTVLRMRERRSHSAGLASPTMLPLRMVVARCDG